MAKSKWIRVNEAVANGIVKGYRNLEAGVVGGYKKMEAGIVKGFSNITDQFVARFLTRDGESVEAAKKRLAAEQAAKREKQPRR